MSTVAIVNQKGGVGKTTVTLGLAGAAAARGLSTLVVDLDPQANATSGMGVWGPERTVDDALASEEPGGIGRCVVDAAWRVAGWPTRPRLAPSSPALAAREPQLATDPIGAQDRLAVGLEGLSNDLVLIDCPPSLGLLTVNALFAADAVLVVTEPGAWAIDGVGQITRNLSRIAARRGGRPVLAGIVVNRLARTRDARYWYEQLLDTHGDRVLPPIRQRAAVAEAAAQSLPLASVHREGAADALAEFDVVLDRLVPRAEQRSAGPELGGSRVASPTLHSETATVSGAA